MNESASRASRPSRSIREKFALVIRVSHWINFPVLVIMIWSGALIYWANPAYWPHWPDSFYESLHLDGRLAEGMAFHFTFMWLFAFNGLLYGTYLLVTGEWRQILPHRSSFREAWQVLQHDLGFAKELPPQGKLNAAQRIAYSGVLLMGFASILTGLAIYKPIQLGWLKQLCGGYPSARLVHYLLAVGFVLFFIMHIVQVTRSGWNQFRAMVTGYEVVEDHEHSD